MTFISCKYFNFFLFSVLVRKCKGYMCYFLVHYCTRKLAISHPMKFEDSGSLSDRCNYFMNLLLTFKTFFSSFYFVKILEGTSTFSNRITYRLKLKCKMFMTIMLPELLCVGYFVGWNEIRGF